MENKKEAIASKQGYIVSEDGILYNKKGEKVGYVYEGYHRTAMRVNGNHVAFKTHRLQAFQKYGYKLFEEGILVRHFNGNSLDNSWDNILIGTQSDNMLDIPENIRIKKSFHASSFVRKYDKEKVKLFHSIDKSYIKTMKEFNIKSKGTLNYLLKN